MDEWKEHQQARGLLETEVERDFPDLIQTINAGRKAVLTNMKSSATSHMAYNSTALTTLTADLEVGW